jgi:hypothetical protein
MLDPSAVPRLKFNGVAPSTHLGGRALLNPDHTGEYLQSLKETVDEVPSTDRPRLLGGNVRHAFGF